MAINAVSIKLATVALCVIKLTMVTAQCSMYGMKVFNGRNINNMVNIRRLWRNVMVSGRRKILINNVLLYSMAALIHVNSI
jgi:hypothetical protein